MTEYDLTCEESGVRLDKYISSSDIGVSRSMAVQLIENGSVSVNGKPSNKKQKLNIGDLISVCVPDPVPYEAKAEDIPLEIVYEDDDLLVVNKPKGMVVHPAAGNYDGTLVNALLFHCGDSLSGINGVMRPGIVHRIDKDTSGLLIVAKNDTAHAGLAAQIKEHSFTREYEAVVFGWSIAKRCASRKRTAKMPLPVTRSLAATGDTLILSAYSRPDAPIKSGCIWLILVIRLREIRFTG